MACRSFAPWASDGTPGGGCAGHVNALSGDAYAPMVEILVGLACSVASLLMIWLLLLTGSRRR
jgi:hypothetical protein